MCIFNNSIDFVTELNGDIEMSNAIVRIFRNRFFPTFERKQSISQRELQSRPFVQRQIKFVWKVQIVHLYNSKGSNQKHP